jgi:hypothetical protein
MALSSSRPIGRGLTRRPVTYRIRHVQRADAAAWAALRAELWPDEDPELLASEVVRFVDGRPLEALVSATRWP